MSKSFDYPWVKQEINIEEKQDTHLTYIRLIEEEIEENKEILTKINDALPLLFDLEYSLLSGDIEINNAIKELLINSYRINEAIKKKENQLKEYLSKEADESKDSDNT